MLMIPSRLELLEQSPQPLLQVMENIVGVRWSWRQERQATLTLLTHPVELLELTQE
jgi:hypothetical protein